MVSDTPPVSPRGLPPRGGFDSAQFRQIEHSLMRSSLSSGVTSPTAGPSPRAAQPAKSPSPSACTAGTVATASSQLCDGPPGRLDGLREAVYRVIDSVLVCALLCVLMTADAILFAIFFARLLSIENCPLHSVILVTSDWALSLAHAAELHARLFSYGPAFYFRSIIRTIEYIVLIIYFVLIISYLTTRVPALLLFRFVRMLRLALFLIRWRERYINWATRTELLDMERLVAQQHSPTTLAPWRIESTSLTLGRTAGAGAFGIVFSGLFRGTLVAVKQIKQAAICNENDSPESGCATFDDSEADMLVNLRHPNVLLFMGIVREPGRLWLVTEYCSRGSLRDLLSDTSSKLSAMKKLRFALGAARGLAYLHGQAPPVLHLDLKPSNVLVSSGWEAKIGDFGLSTTMLKRSVQRAAFLGTLPYAAPEVLRHDDVSAAADIFAFGICLWELFTKQVPGNGLPSLKLAVDIAERGWRPATDVFVPYRRKFSDIAESNASGSGPKIGRRNTPLSIRKKDLLPVIRRQVPDTSFHSRLMARNNDIDNIGAPALDPMQSQARSVEIVVDDEWNARSSVAAPAAATLSRNEVTRRAFSDSRLEAQHRRSIEVITHSKKQPHGTLDGLSRKVTDAICRLDDRPPVAHRAAAVKESVELSNTIAENTRIPKSTTNNNPGDSLSLDIETRAAAMEDLYAESEGDGLADIDDSGYISIPADCLDLMRECWAADPADRPSASELVWRLIILMDEERKAKLAPKVFKTLTSINK